MGFTALLINHRGLILEGNETATVADLAFMGAITPLKDYLDKHPKATNVPAITHSTKPKLLNVKELTPLAAAVFGQEEDAIRLLLARNADPLAPDDIGGALFAAIAVKRFDLFNTLHSSIKTPLNREMKNPQGSSLLAEFCKATLTINHSNRAFWEMAADCFRKISDPQKTLVDQIMAHKANPYLLEVLGEKKAVDEEGNSLIMKAIQAGDAEYFKRLIGTNSFDLEVKNHQGQTALTLALNHQDEEIASEIVFYLYCHHVSIPPDLQPKVDHLLDPKIHRRWHSNVEF